MLFTARYLRNMSSPFPTLVHLRTANGVPVVAFMFPRELEEVALEAALSAEFNLDTSLRTVDVIVGTGYQHIFTVVAKRDELNDFNRRFLEAMGKFLVGPMSTYNVRFEGR